VPRKKNQRRIIFPSSDTEQQRTKHQGNAGFVFESGDMPFEDMDSSQLDDVLSQGDMNITAKHESSGNEKPQHISEIPVASMPSVIKTVAHDPSENTICISC
jgi:hypothetical protein